MWYRFLNDLSGYMAAAKGGLTHRPEGIDSSITKHESFAEWFGELLSFALGFVALLTTAIIIYGGFVYITAAGDQEKAAKGKKVLTYSIIGMMIIILAFSIVNTLIGGFGGSEVEVGDGGSSGGGFVIELFESDDRDGGPVAVPPISVTPVLELSSSSVAHGDVVHLDGSKSVSTTGSRAYVWDFDTATDSDGDGHSDNDSNSSSEKTFIDTGTYYGGPGDYTIKLTVKSSGIEQSTTSILKVN